MDQRDLELIAKYGEADPELKSLYEEHVAFEKILEKMEGKAFLTPSKRPNSRKSRKRSFPARRASKRS